jgi:monoamine oxidase
MISRSDFIKFLGSMAALPIFCKLIPERSVDIPNPKEPDFNPDVCIIGGGLAGLSCSRELSRNGVSNQIVEAQNILGGRVKTSYRKDGSFQSENGAQLISRDQKYIIKTLKQSGMTYVSMNDNGRIFLLKGNEKIYPDNASDYSDPVSLLNNVIISEKNSIHDSNVLDLIDQKIKDPQLKRSIIGNVKELIGKEPELISTKALIDMGLRYESDYPDEYLSTEGLQKMISFLALSSMHKPLTSFPVTNITKIEGGYLVASPMGKIRCKKVVMAVPPTVIKKIKIQPELPIKIQEAINSFIAGDMIKISLIFRKPYWRDSGYQGGFQSVDFQGITTVDGSDSTVANGRLIIFIGADQARRLAKLTELDRQTFTLDLIEKAFPGAKNQFLEYTEGVWVNHPWSGGGYNSFVKYGGNSNARSILRDYNSDIVFAGSEIAEVFPGYMDGAIRSGIRTATRLLKA